MFSVPLLLLKRVYSNAPPPRVSMTLLLPTRHPTISARTAFFGAIVRYHDGTVSRLYKAYRWAAR
jgi:hypothetical protein